LSLAGDKNTGKPVVFGIMAGQPWAKIAQTIDSKGVFWSGTGFALVMPCKHF
jgi:hypothetical protein